jgi:hypothetical protein
VCLVSNIARSCSNDASRVSLSCSSGSRHISETNETHSNHNPLQAYEDWRAVGHDLDAYSSGSRDQPVIETSEITGNVETHRDGEGGSGAAESDRLALLHKEVFKLELL